MSDSPSSDERELPSLEFAVDHPLPPISLPLHEAVGLCMLYAQADSQLLESLRDSTGVFYGFSAARGALRLADQIAKLFADDDARDRLAVKRAMLDQLEASW